MIVIISTFLIGSIPLGILYQQSLGQEPIEPVEPVEVVPETIYDVSGSWAPMGALSVKLYNSATIETATSSGLIVFTYKIVPYYDLPFSIPAEALVFVYHSENGYIFGWYTINGWWIMFTNQATRDQVIISYLQIEAEAYL